MRPGAATINLIRPKPAPGNERWYGSMLFHCRTPLGSFHAPAMQTAFSKTNLTVDCAILVPFHGWPDHALQEHSVAGCAMGDRFATVKWNGDVSPCSHLHGEEFKAGNVNQTSFREIWKPLRSSIVFGKSSARSRGIAAGADITHSAEAAAPS